MPELIDQTSLTLGDHLLRLAEAVGCAETVDENGNNITARVPTEDSNPGTRDMLMRAWNDGYFAFLSGADPLNRPGRVPYNSWNFLDRMVQITMSPDGTGADCIAGDNTRYRLPAGVASRPKHAWDIEISDRTVARTVEDTNVHRVLMFLHSTAATGSTGYPFMAACRPIPAPEGDAAGAAWEVLVAPRPTVAATMTAQFHLVPRRLNDEGQRTICGAQHDPTIIAFAIMEWYRRDTEDQSKFARYVSDAAAKLDASVQLDRNMSPRTVGPVRDPGIDSLPVTRPQARRASGVNTTYTLSQ